MRAQFKSLYRQARLGNLGTLATTGPVWFYPFALETFDLRIAFRSFSKHPRFPRSFDSLRSGAKVRLRYRE